MLENIFKVKEQVRYILENYEPARNSDALLYKYLAKTFYNIDLNGIEELPILESVSRARRYFQAKGLYLAKPLVSEGRAKNRKEYKKEYSPKAEVSGL